MSNSTKYITLFMPAMLLCAIGCSALSSSSLKENSGAQTGTLDWSGWSAGKVLEIDGQPTGSESRAELMPGRHEIVFGGRIGTSFLLNRKMHDNYAHTGLIDVRPGRYYSVMHERVYGLGGYGDYFWIEDLTTGEVVAGSYPGYDKEKTERSHSARQQRQTEDHFQFLLESAQCGSPEAQYEVGVYFLTGLPPLTHRDAAKAWSWFGLAESNGIPKAGEIRQRIGGHLSADRLHTGKEYQSRFKAVECSDSDRTANHRGEIQ